MRVELRNVSKRYGATVALRDVSLELAAGSIVAVVGRNGAGKTTLLQAVCGVIGLDRGEVLFDGERFARARVDQRRRFFVIPDTPAVFAGMTPIQYGGMIFKLYGRDADGPDALAAALAQRYAELEILPQANLPLGTLSRGQLYKAVRLHLGGERLAARPAAAAGR